MAFGLNRAELIGRLGADVTINHLASGGRVANLSIATDEGYVDKQSGERVGQDRVAPGRDLPARPGRYVREAREEGPPGLRRGQAPDPPLEEGRGGLGPVLDRDPHRAWRARPVPRQGERERQWERQRRARRDGGRGGHCGRSGRRHSILSASWAGVSRVGPFFCSLSRGSPPGLLSRLPGTPGKSPVP